MLNLATETAPNLSELSFHEDDRRAVEEIEQSVAGFLTGELPFDEAAEWSAEDLYQVADLGYDLAAEGRLLDARRIFEGLYCCDPYDAQFHSALGSIYQKQGLLQSAIDHYLTAMELWEDDPSAKRSAGAGSQAILADLPGSIEV